MAEQTTSEVQHTTPVANSEANFLSPDVTMLILTWVTFFSLLAVLYKFAWKPILAALDAREKTLRQSLENADKIERQLAAINEVRAKALSEAEAKSKEMYAQAQKAATEAVRIIHEKAKEEAKILLENARREIKDESEKAQASLRAESARIAVDLAGKLIEKNLDDEKNRKIVDDFIKNI